MANPTTNFPLGTFVGNPGGHDAAQEQAFEQQYNAFVSAMGGARPLFMDSFVDYFQDPSSWAGSASYSAWTWTQSGSQFVGKGSGVTPVVGVPMASNAAGGSNVDTFYQQIIAGTYDSAYRGIVDAWAGSYPTVQFRVGYEFNGNFNPWSPADSSNPNAQADFVAAFQHVAGLIHAESKNDGITGQVVWNPADLNNNVVTANLYPGDSSVDIISSDAYSTLWPLGYVDWANGGNTQISAAAWGAVATDKARYWQYPNATQYYQAPGTNATGWSFSDTVEFAQAHNKPISLSETGAGPSSSPVGPADEADFPQWLAGALAQARAAGVTVQNVNIWDTTQGDGDWQFTNGSKPQEAAAWGKYFGANSTNTMNIAEPTTVGSGPDRLVLQISEDMWQGDAVFTVAVDGTPVGGLLTAGASHAAGQSQAYTVLGTFGAGNHTATVTFRNDAWGGSAAADRNLYVTGATIDGAAISGAVLNEGSNGAQSFTFQGAATAAATTVSAGSGLDTLALLVSEDAYNGDAQFTVAVDGAPVGGTFTTTALHGAGQSQTFNILGAFGAGTHTATVNFLNDAWGGSAATDRNLYVTGATIDGAAVGGAVLNEGRGGPQSFTFQGAAGTGSGTTNPGTTNPGTTNPGAGASLGSGPDSIVLNVSEDAYKGDAQYTVSVDGAQFGGTQTASASHAAGQTQAVTLHGAFGAGPHTVSVNFLNDLYAGTAATDRNLYVDNIVDGATVTAGSALLSGGAKAFFIGGSSPVTVGSGAQKIVLQMAEDAWGGDAQFSVRVDGQQIGGTLTTTALHAAGQMQEFDIAGAFKAGSHQVAVSFLNDAYGGSAATDRNLFVDKVGGTTVNAGFGVNGTQTFTAVVPAP